jgi:hypothetical protein
LEQWAAVVRGAVSDARTLPNVDPDGVGIVGFSLGGYLTAGVVVAQKHHVEVEIRAGVGHVLSRPGRPANLARGSGRRSHGFSTDARSVTGNQVGFGVGRPGGVD